MKHRLIATLLGLCSLVLVIVSQPLYAVDNPSCVGRHITGHQSWSLTWGGPSESSPKMCAGDTMTFSASATDTDTFDDPGNCDEELTYTWDAGNGPVTGKTFALTPLQLGSVTITGTVSGMCKSCTGPFTKTWSVDVVGIDGLSASSTVVNVNTPVTFTATGYFGSQVPPLSPNWNGASFSQGTTNSTTSTAIASWSSAGTYTVSVSLSMCPSQTKSVLVTVVDPNSPGTCSAGGASYSGTGGCSSCGSNNTPLLTNSRDGMAMAGLSSDAAAVMGPGFASSWSAARPPFGANRNMSSTPGALDWPNCDGSCFTAQSDGTTYKNGVKNTTASWDSTNKRLTVGDGSTVQFDSSGMAVCFSGTGGTQPTNITYDTRLPGRPAQAEDARGNIWSYGVDANVPGPSYAIDPAGDRKAAVSYWKSTDTDFTGGESLPKRITVQRGNNWSINDSWTDYQYDSSNRVTSISETKSNPDDPNNPDVTTTNSSYDANGKLSEVTITKNGTVTSDTTYSYGEEMVDGYAYSGTQTRIRKTPGIDSNTDDRVARTLYYRNANGDPTYVFREILMESDGNGGLRDYANVEYQRYGFLDRFPSPPTDKDEAVLVGLVRKQMDARGKTTTYTYSTDNQMITRVDLPNGTDYATTSYVKDINGKDTIYVVTMMDTRGKYTKYTRDTSNPDLVTAIAVSDNGVDYTTVKRMSYYSSPSAIAGMLQTMTVPGVEDGTGDEVTTYGYQDPESGKYRASPTSTSYDYWNGTAYVTEYSQTSYDDDGHVKWSKDAEGNRTDFIYDESKRPIETIAPADSYDGGYINASTMNSITIAWKHWVPDQFVGMLLVVNGNSYPIVSNTANSITVTVGPDQPSLLSVRATADIRPYTMTQYKSCCELPLARQDSRGKVTHYSYDSANRLAKTWTDISGQSETYPLTSDEYDCLNKKTSTTTYADSNTGRTTSYTYNQLGRLVKLAYPTSGGTRLLDDEYFQYDKAGLMVAKMVGHVTSNVPDSGYTLTEYGYDDLGRLISVKYGGSTAVWPIGNVDANGDISISSPSISYTYYNGSSLIHQLIDASLGTSTFDYDAQGNLTSYIPSLPANYEVDYTYNNASQKTSVVVKSSGTNLAKTGYFYFRNGQLKQVKGYDSNGTDWICETRCDFAYDSLGRCTNRNNYSSPSDYQDVQTEYSYSVRGEMTGVKHWNPGKTTVWYGIAYHRDGTGNPVAVDFSGTYCPPVYQGKTVSYGYDAMNQLTSEQVGTNTPTTWSYDWAGNRSQSFAYSYNAVDELNNGSGYVYNGLGNLVCVPNSSDDNRSTYTYNDANLLSQVDQYSGGNLSSSVSMYWDGDNHRVKIQSGNRTWQFLYDPTASVPAVLLTLDSNDSGPTYCVREPSGELLADIGTAGVRVYSYDAAGSTVLVSDGSGGVLSDAAYGAWGNVVDSSSSESPYQFAGRHGYYMHDSSSQGSGLGDLAELGVRLYDAGTGRFTQRDPARAGLNLYSYVDNNPLGAVDPLGLWCRPVDSDANTLHRTEVKMGTWIKDGLMRADEDGMHGEPGESSDLGPGNNGRGGVARWYTLVSCTMKYKVHVTVKVKYHVQGTQVYICGSDNPRCIDDVVTDIYSQNVDYYTAPSFRDGWLPQTFSFVAGPVPDTASHGREGQAVWDLVCIGWLRQHKSIFPQPVKGTPM